MAQVASVHAAGSPDPFAMEMKSNSLPVSELAPLPGAFYAMMAATAWLTAWLPSVVPLPLWFHATWLGAMFAMISVVSVQLTWRTGRAASACTLAVLLPVAHHSLIKLTSLEFYSAWFVLLAIACGGWLIGLMQRPSLDNEYRREARKQWSIWELLCLTTFTALMVHVAPRVENPLDLACQLAPCVIGGWTLSLLAFEWAWRDRWTPFALACVLILAPGACLLTLTARPDSLDISATALWLISGPASVLAMQGMVTLCFATCRRVL